MKNGAYTALGGVFEELNEDCGYEQWSQYLIKRLNGLNAGNRGVDIGCGNGYFTRALCKAGYHVTGVDISPQMLSRAVDIALDEGVRTEFVLGDIRKLNLNFKPDFAVAVNDCLNYVPQSALKAAIARVYKSLKNGGVFIFDISTPHKLKNILGNNLFAEDGERVTYIWFNSLKDDRVEMDITVFTQRADGAYTRADEHQTQYIHEISDITRIAEECGFSVRTEGHLGESARERVNFICKKA